MLTTKTGWLKKRNNHKLIFRIFVVNKITEMGAATAIVGGVLGVGKAIFGASQQKKARKASERLKQQMGDPTNPFANLTVSTLGAELQSEQALRNLSTTSNYLTNSGVRGLSFIPQAARQKALTDAQIAATLDEQQKQINQQIAQGEIYKQNINENRYLAEQSGYAQQYATGQQNMFGGISDIIGIAASGLAPGGFLSGTSSATSGNNWSSYFRNAGNNIPTSIGFQSLTNG